jgi:hypothetical protein
MMNCTPHDYRMFRIMVVRCWMRWRRVARLLLITHGHLSLTWSTTCKQEQSHLTAQTMLLSRSETNLEKIPDHGKETKHTYKHLRLVIYPKPLSNFDVSGETQAIMPLTRLNNLSLLIEESFLNPYCCLWFQDNNSVCLVH